MGHIASRSKGTWTIWYDLPRGADGRRRQKNHTIRGTKKDAEAELRRIEYEIHNGVHTEPTKIILEQFLNQWLEHIESGVSAKTFQEYRGIVANHLIPSLGHLRVSRIQPLDVQSYYQRLLREGRKDEHGGLSPMTVRHHHTLLHRALQQAVNWRLIPHNPVNAVEPPRVERQEMTVLNESETASLLRYAEHTRLHVPVLVAITTGMRRGEILGLRWTDVDLDKATVAVRRSLQQVKDGLHFKEPKSGRSRAVHLPQISVSALKRHRIEQLERRLQLGSDYHEGDLVCPRENGEPWPPNLLTRNFCDFIERHPDLPRIRLHDLRHGYASLALSRGVHPKVVSEALGHSTIAITLNLYSHVFPSLQQEAASVFDLILEEKQ